MAKKALFLQPFGIGDIIWSQAIAHRFMFAGYEITWPVYPQFLEGLVRAYPSINWVNINGYEKYMNIKTDGFIDGYEIVPIRWCVEITGLPYNKCMEAKYIMYDLDFNMWKEFAMPIRDYEYEEELFYKVLGLKDLEEYRLINRFFRSDSSGCAQIPHEAHIRTVEMCSILDYSLFDWMMVIERAAEIHTVSTSLLYLLELMDLDTTPEIYLRWPDEKNFKNIDGITTKKYKFHN